MIEAIKNPRLRATVTGLVIFNVVGSIILFALDMLGLMPPDVRQNLIYVAMVIDLILIVTFLPVLFRR